jgi:predicted amidohydrolase YtcJ
MRHAAFHAARARLAPRLPRSDLAFGFTTLVDLDPKTGTRAWFDAAVPRPETLETLREETRRRGLSLVVHANGVEGWRAAMDAHADVIAHGLWHWPGSALVARAVR